jgi:hypothetical protein
MAFGRRYGFSDEQKTAALLIAYSLVSGSAMIPVTSFRPLDGSFGSIQEAAVSHRDWAGTPGGKYACAYSLVSINAIPPCCDNKNIPLMMLYASSTLPAQAPLYFDRTELRTATIY